MDVHDVPYRKTARKRLGMQMRKLGAGCQRKEMRGHRFKCGTKVVEARTRIAGKAHRRWDECAATDGLTWF
jgi:hypothetical protein